MVIHDLHLEGVSITPDEADSILVIDADAVLSRPVSLEGLQSIARRYSKVLKVLRPVEHEELPQSYPVDASRKTPGPLSMEQPLGISRLEAPDHAQMI